MDLERLVNYLVPYEETQLIEERKLKEERWTRRIFKFFLARSTELTVARLYPPAECYFDPNSVNFSEKKRDHKGRIVFRYYTILNDHERVATSLRLLIILLGFNIGFFRSVIIIALLMQYHHNLDSWKPQLIPGANVTRDCALPSDVLNIPVVMMEDLRELKRSLAYLGAPQLGNPGILESVILTLLVVDLCMKFSAIVVNLSSRPAYLECLDFLMDPIGTRRRTHKQQIDLVHKMLNMEDRLDHDRLDFISSLPNGLSRRSSSITLPPELPSVDGLLMNQISSQRKFQLYQVSQAPEMLRVEDKASFVRFIRSERLTELLQPIHLSDAMYRRCIASVLVAGSLGILVAILTPMIIVYRLYILESTYRVDQRVNYLKCKIWNPSSELLRDPFVLDKINLTDSSFLAKLSESELRNLAASLENLKTFDMRLISGMIIQMVHWFLVSAWIILAVTIMSASFVYQFKWTSEIQARLNGCIELLERYNQVKSSGILGGSCIILGNESKRQLMKALTITYFQYEFFKVKMKHFRVLLSIMGPHIAILTMGVGAVSCMNLNGSGTNEPKIFFIWICATVCIVGFNVFFASCTTAINKLTKISKQISTMMAKVCTQSIELSYIVMLWRRQLLTESEIARFYDINMLGIQFSQSKLLTFNSYLLGVGLFVLRSSIFSH